jgi:ADP-heptose:LPS heptosyltransferase
VLRRFVLIFHSAALGDSILTWPMVLTLARLRPQQRVVVVAPGEKAQLAADVLGVEADDVEAWSALFGEGAVLPEAKARRLRQAAEVFTFLAEPDDAWSQNVRRLGGDALKLHHLNAKPQGVHAADHLIRQLPTDADRQGGASVLSHLKTRGLGRPLPAAGPVLIHPGSGSPTKNWPAQRFAHVAAELRKAGRTTTFVRGEVERERMAEEDVEQLAHATDAEASPKTLAELHALLRTATGYVGNDTGPTHLAAALGLPTAAVFVATDPALWRPLGPKVSVFDADADPAAVAASL